MPSVSEVTVVQGAGAGAGASPTMMPANVNVEPNAKVAANVIVAIVFFIFLLQLKFFSFDPKLISFVLPSLFQLPCHAVPEQTVYM